MESLKPSTAMCTGKTWISVTSVCYLRNLCVNLFVFFNRCEKFMRELD